MLGVALAVATGAVLYRRMTTPPAWWTPELSSDAHAAELAEDAEKGMTRVLSREREPGASWSVEITQDQANAWLATRLERWTRSQHAEWPVAVRGVRVGFAEGSVTIGVAIDAGGAVRYVSLTLAPDVAKAGTRRLRATQARVGVQEVPLSRVRSTVARHLPDGALPPQAMDAISRGAIDLPESFALDDARRLRIIGVEARAARLRVVLESIDR